MPSASASPASASMSCNLCRPVDGTSSAGEASIVVLESVIEVDER